MDLNKGISTPIAILLVAVTVLVAGGAVWYFTNPGEQPQPTSTQPSDYTTQATCENEGYYWYDDSCHEEKREELEITEFPQPWENTNWYNPTSIEKSGASWEGVLEEIYPKQGIIKAIQMPSGVPEYTILIQDDTEITNSRGEFSLQELQRGDVIAVSKGEYQMKGKYESETTWEVLINATEINFLQKCVGEGERREEQRSQCCFGLSLIGSNEDGFYCTKCGDDICKGPEGKDNCPLDCTKIGEQISLSVSPDPSTVTLEEEVINFTGEVTPGFVSSKTEEVKVTADKNTKFSVKVSLEKAGETLSQSNFYSKLKKSEGPMSRSFRLKGVLLEQNKIKATEMWKGVQ